MLPLLAIKEFLLRPKTLAILGLAAVLAYAGFRLHEVGLRAGYQQGQTAQLETDKQSMQQDRAAFQDKIAAAQRDLDRANEVIKSATVALDAANSRLASLAAKREADLKNLASLNDSQLEGDVVAKLKLRPVSDTAAGFYPQELREIDRQVTDYPNLSAANAGLGDKISALEKEVSGLDDRTSALEKQRDAALAFGNQMLGHYTRAYNAAQKKPSAFLRFVSFGLYHGRHLDLPDPVTLKCEKCK